MNSPINIEILRRDLMNHYGTEIFAGFDGALADLIEVDKGTEEELIKHAKKVGIDVQKYKG